MTECPRCGRCAEPGITTCPADGSRMTPVPTVPRVIDGRYRLEQVIGRGGMGAVYRGWDTQLEREVAVKIVRAELLSGEQAQLRFRRDAQIVERLRHPAIVAIYEFGTFAAGGAYLVMEFVRGEDLRRVLQRERHLEPDRAAEILTSVCAGVEAAHRDGVLHLDLKPENVLLSGADGAAKILDFGFARALDERHERSGRIIIGTPAYMAPEQLRGEAPDARADVFSLGVIAYEMLSGDLPFGRGSLAEVVFAQTRGLRPPGAALGSAAIERAIRAALDPDVDRRPASLQAFAHLLRAALRM